MSFAYCPIYSGDYLRDTRHLSPAKHGIYFLLLLHCWDQKGPVPLDEQEAAGIANCRSGDEIDALRYVLTKFFVRMDDGWYNKRMQLEIERFENISRQRSSAGRLGYQAKAKQLASKCLADAKHLPLSPSPSQEEDQRLTATPPAAATPRLVLTPPPCDEATKATPRAPAYPAGFARFWAAYPPGRRDAKAECLKAWRAKGLEGLADRVVNHIEALKKTEKWRGGYEPSPLTYLRQDRFHDDPPATGDDADRRAIAEMMRGAI